MILIVHSLQVLQGRFRQRSQVGYQAAYLNSYRLRSLRLRDYLHRNYSESRSIYAGMRRLDARIHRQHLILVGNLLQLGKRRTDRLRGFVHLLDSVDRAPRYLACFLCRAEDLDQSPAAIIDQPLE